jgi:deazaflavin-dependent oxidoreductase (nitroreductase family)
LSAGSRSRVEGERWAIFASKAGAPVNPDWYHNLKANPNTVIEVGPETIEVTAAELTGDERNRVFESQKAEAPQFAEYEPSTDRIIPVVVFNRR